MSFGLGCGRIFFWMLTVTGTGGVLYLLFCLDKDFRSCQVKKIVLSMISLCLSGICLLPDWIYEEPPIIQICYTGMLVYLITCAVMDIQLKMVCDFLHYAGLLCVIAVMYATMADRGCGWSVILFAIIQKVVFSQMYGAADVAMYMVCAAFLGVQGRGMEVYLIHMLVTFGLLGTVQGLKKNIAGNGNLKSPVALIPYVVISFFLII